MQRTWQELVHVGVDLWDALRQPPVVGALALAGVLMLIGLATR